jgi:hypothetical protein
MGPLSLIFPRRLVVDNYTFRCFGNEGVGNCKVTRLRKNPRGGCVVAVPPQRILELSG